MMNTNDNLHQPIGYWLNRTDQALTTRMNEILQTDGITRFGWQVLNVLQAEGSVLEAHLYAALQANASQATLTDTVEALVVKGWVMPTEHEPGAPSPRISLTSAGRAEHARILDRIAYFRHQSLYGISAEEY